MQRNNTKFLSGEGQFKEHSYNFATSQKTPKRWPLGQNFFHGVNSIPLESAQLNLNVQGGTLSTGAIMQRWT